LLFESGIDPLRIRISVRGVGSHDPKVDNCEGQNNTGKPRYGCIEKGLRLKPKEALKQNRRIEVSIGIYSVPTSGQLPSR
jgi:outer membrane protein OmpA-like peptidoglycan-associated protein